MQRAAETRLLERRRGKVGLLSDRELMTLMFIIIRAARRIRNRVITLLPVVALLVAIHK